MAQTPDSIKTALDTDIVANGVGAITGPVLNSALTLLLLATMPVHVVAPADTFTVPAERCITLHNQFSVKGTLTIEGGAPDSNYGSGAVVSTDGILNLVDAALLAEGTLNIDGTLNLL